ncbi:hypothetical protein Vretimale_6445 [Volvox reticuliferus]|uniref:Uncharacterized protein n=1 Tax=Volvox reticuliferus TaxID=1737510 RepID=A0A8J4G7S2_9CHLO|nr:hypothetical protein Vretifemale_20015 [Volvox reticuliferus]GIM01704.1 hypothetical protein Vretimale_6445 [Volvox reticuliferus]
MEALKDMLLGIGAGCQNLQRQESASQPVAGWAGVRATRGLGNALDSAGQLVLFPGAIGKTAWASKMRCAPKSRVFHLVSRTYSNGSPFASLVVSSGRNAFTAALLPDGGGGQEDAQDRSGCRANAQRLKQQEQQQQKAVADVQAADRQQRPPTGGWHQLRDLSGTWIKNRESSQSMEDAMNLMRLNGIVRQAVKLVKGVHIKVEPDNFTFTVFSFISWFKVKEVYPMNGDERHYRRRDLRRGGAMGRVEPQGRNIQVHLRWNDPFGGQGRDFFRLVSQDELHIDSVIEVAGQTARYLTVYNRKPDRRRKRLQEGCAVHLASSEAGDDGAGSDHGVQRGGGDTGGKK